jgi:hypothetical protein
MRSVSKTRGTTIWRSSAVACSRVERAHLESLVPVGRAQAFFHLLGLPQGRLQAERNVARQHVSADGNRRGVDRAAQRVDGDVGRPAANVEQHDPDLLLLGQEGRCRARERLKNHRLRFQAGALNALEHVGDKAGAAGDDVRVDLEAAAGHSDRIVHAFLPVDGEVARQCMNDLAVARKIDDLAGVDHAANVAGRHFTVLARNRDDGSVIRAADVIARNPDEDLVEMQPGHTLGFFRGGFNRFDRLLEVDDDAFAHP